MHDLDNTLGRMAILWRTVITVFLYFVLLFRCQVGCDFVHVRRGNQDVFSFTGVSRCPQFCSGKQALAYEFSRESNRCFCRCNYSFSSFVVAKLKCVKNEAMRNTDKLEFKLNPHELPSGYIKVLSFEGNLTTILFKAPGYSDCYLNDLEELDYQDIDQWVSTRHYLLRGNISEVDGGDIKRDNLAKGWRLLTLHWHVNSIKFAGRIMRINITCQASDRRGPFEYKTGVMVFKVNGTFSLPVNSSSSLSLVPTISTSFTIASIPSATVETSVPRTSSIAQYLSTTSSGLKTMMPSPQISMSLSPSAVPKSLSEVGTRGFITYSVVSSSMVIASSSVMMDPATTSESSSNSAATGGIVAAIVVLLLVFVILVYVLRKRRMKVLSRKHSDLGQINPASVSSVMHIPALANPLNDGVYENPEVLNDTKHSGVTSIESAAYDACLIVENPSARDVKSVYDNIPAPPDATYKALDPAKREPSLKYQSLIKNKEHEYSAMAGGKSGTPIQEPFYSEVEEDLSLVNYGGFSGPIPHSLAPRKPPTSPVNEHIYSELENSGGNAPEGDTAASLEVPRYPLGAPNKAGDNKQADEVTSDEEETTAPVYSVLESNEMDV